MKYKWAEKLINEGSIRLGSLEYHRKFEKNGDPNEGKGMYRLNGNQMTMESANGVFLILCCALPDTSIDKLFEIFNERNYDTIISISDVEKFVKRIETALKNNALCYPSYVFITKSEKINYNRGSEVSQKALNNQQPFFEVFQKSSCFKDENEYRIAFLFIPRFPRGENDCNLFDKDYWDINIGNCSDIVQIKTRK